MVGWNPTPTYLLYAIAASKSVCYVRKVQITQGNQMTNGDKLSLEDVDLLEGTPRKVDAPTIYFNGFELAGSLSDMNCVLMADGEPVAKLNMSFTTAKTLSVNLSQTVSAFEQATEHSVMTMDDVKKGYEKNVKKR